MLTYENLPVASCKSYPPIKVTKPNIQYAKLLSQTFASSSGEMTAIFQYLYQHWILQKQNNSFAKVLFRISLVEMTHLDILGELITLLGGDPRCAAVEQNKFIYWNGAMPDYSQDLKEMLSTNAKSEGKAIQEYKELASKISDPYIYDILTCFAKDEEIHYRIFKDYLNQIC